ncbi:MAG TPA: GDYXXLXY domain-containing protein [Mesorhizobium sp.]|jgi:uncharacterized membrane-anchored protein|nr:GDYXXLXY domain-containing protein [Mesorhizobium sp.]
MSRLVAAALVVALLQIGFLSWVITGRAAILRNGAEVLLRIEPVDPRDLLRGDYVQLAYGISNLPVRLIADRPPEAGLSDGETIKVRLAKTADGTWDAVAAYLGEPPAEPEPEQVDIAGRIPPGWALSPESTVPVAYGIERFYLPEGEGLAIEIDTRMRPFTMAVAVAEDGTAQIKALMDGEDRLYEEPLY